MIYYLRCISLFFVIFSSGNGFAQVTANFSADDTVGYAPFTVNFANQSTGYITSYIWTFGDNNGFSVVQNPSYTYTIPGKYAVQLHVSNGFFTNTITKPNYIIVNQNPLPPIITSFSPFSDSAGEIITIHGQHFTSTTAVNFGVSKALYFSVLSDTIITAVVGEGATGAVYVIKQGAIDSLTGFTYLPPPNTISLPPTIKSFSPMFGAIGTPVVIKGTNFDTVLRNNMVHFGAVKASVISGNTTTLIVRVPVGTTYKPITVTTAGLIAYSQSPFNVTFLGGDSILSVNSFASKKDYPAGALPAYISAQDFNDDDKPDFITVNAYGNSFSLFKNISIPQLVSIMPKIDYSLNPYPGGGIISDLNGDNKADILFSGVSSDSMLLFKNTSITNAISFSKKNIGIFNGWINIGDMDGDGKPDIVAATGADSILTYRNNRTDSGISFASAKSFIFGNNSSSEKKYYNSVICDLDGDNKLDYATIDDGESWVEIFKNISYPGKIQLAINDEIECALPNGQLYYPFSLSAADFNGDGKPDLIFASNIEVPSFSIFLNTSVPGAISFAAPIAYNINASSNPVDLTINDFNGDGKPDIAIAESQTSAVGVFLNNSNNGNLSFEQEMNYPVAGNPTAINSADIDMDGKPDIIVSSQTTNSISILRNQMGELPQINFCPSMTSSICISSVIGMNYQWQVDTGKGFININNNSNYNGVTNDTLQLINIPSAWYGYQYRCIVDGNNGRPSILKFTDVWTGAVDSLWTRSANWSCGTIPDSNTDVIVNSGTVILGINATIRSLTVSEGASLTIMVPFNLNITH